MIRHVRSSLRRLLAPWRLAQAGFAGTAARILPTHQWAGLRSSWIRRQYDRTAEQFDRWSPSDEFVEIFGATVERAIRQRQACRVLEIGCGNGHWLERLADLREREGLAVDLAGMDLSPRRIERAERRLAGRAVRLHAGDLFTLDPVDSSFDAIFLCEVWRYFPDADYKATLDRCLALLAPGGSLIVIDKDRHGAFAATVRRDWLTGVRQDIYQFDRCVDFGLLVRAAQEVGGCIHLAEVGAFRSLTLEHDGKQE